MININDIDEFDVEPGIDTDPIPNAVDENSGNGAPGGSQRQCCGCRLYCSGNLFTRRRCWRQVHQSIAAPVQVTAIGNLDFETQSSHSITVRAASSDGSESTQSFAIQVQDVNEPPSGNFRLFWQVQRTLTPQLQVYWQTTPMLMGISYQQCLSRDHPMGRLVLNGDGSFNYTADVGFVGIDTFRYQATDGILN